MRQAGGADRNQTIFCKVKDMVLASLKESERNDEKAAVMKRRGSRHAQ